MSSPKRYQIDFYKGDSLLVSELEFLKIKGLLGQTSLFEVQGRVINASNIANMQEYKSYEDDNKWQMPEEVKPNRHNLELLRQMKTHLLNKMTSKNLNRTYTPKDDLPPEWYDSFTKKGYDLENKQLSLPEQEALNNDIAIIDENGYILYNYQGLLQQSQKKRMASAHDAAWEQRLALASDG